MRLYPYEGIKVTGWAKTVILRGKKIIVNGDNFLAEKGFGEYIRRDIKKTTGA